MLRIFRSLPKILIELNKTSPLADFVPKRQAGHSKWANIKHTKALKDSQRSILFTKLARQMRVAAEEGGSLDPSKNVKLEQIIEQAKRLNMPSATIQSILKSMQTDKSKCKTHIVEIRGPGGCLILCEVFTSNLHHSKQTMMSILRKHMSKLSDGGGTKHLFEQKGVIDTQLPKIDDKQPDEILMSAIEDAIEAGADDVKLTDDNSSLQFMCSHLTFNSVLHKLDTTKYKITNAGVEFVPLKLQELSDEDLNVCSNLYDKLENLTEVVKLYDNIA